MVKPLTQAAIFLVLTVNDGAEEEVRQLLPDVAGLTRSVGFRVPDGELSCVAGIGSELWDRLFGGAAAGAAARPADDRRRRAHAPSRPPATCCSTSARAGWICASSSPGSSWTGSRDGASVVDEVHGFKYFDERDLLGFVDGTENPSGRRRSPPP